MKAALLLVLLSLGHIPRARADEPVASALVPRCYSAEERVNIAKVITGQDARIKSLEADAGKVPVVPLIVTAAIALAAGFAAGFGVKSATQPK